MAEIIFPILHLIIVLFITIHLLRSFSVKKREEIKFRGIHLTVEFLLTILLGACFINYDMSSFEGEKYFPEFVVITLISATAYWIAKADLKMKRPAQLTVTALSSSLFWLSLFTFVKFLPYLPYVWFPLLGLMALAPFFLCLMAFSEINFRSRTQTPIYQSLLLGLIPIILLQLTMNTYTPYNWEFFALFDPKNTTIF